MNWSTSCVDWESRIIKGESLIPFSPLFPDEAAAALRTFKGLRIVDAPGRPTFGEAADQWVFDLVTAIFGSYNRVTGEQLINEFFVCVAKKNGKSTLAAGIMLTALIRNWRHSNELIVVAPTIQAANSAFKPAADMIRTDRKLNADGHDAQGHLHIVDHERKIKHMVTGSTLQIVAADTGTVAGSKAGYVMIDELWEFGNRESADRMLREATGGRVTKPEGFLVTTTTQSDKEPAGVFKDKLDYARDVRDGKVIDPKFLPLIYEFPQHMIDTQAYTDPANFYVSNPFLGKLKTGRDWIANELTKEQAKGIETRNVFLAKHLNIEIGMNLRANRWPGADHWAPAVHPELAAIYRQDPYAALHALLDRVECVTVGGDGGGLDDLWGLTVLGREPAEIEVEVMVAGKLSTQTMQRWLCWSHAWCHRGVLDLRKSIASRLLDFEKAGELTIIENNSLEDLAAIIEIIAMVKNRDLLGGVGVDPAGLGDFVDALANPDIDITTDNGLLRGAPQGFGLMNAIKTTERRLAKGLLQHCGGLLMPWCVANLKIEPTATAIRATKQNAGDAKIDPAMALFDAVVVMATNPQPVAAFDVMAMVA